MQSAIVWIGGGQTAVTYQLTLLPRPNGRWRVAVQGHGELPRNPTADCDLDELQRKLLVFLAMKKHPHPAGGGDLVADHIEVY